MTIDLPVAEDGGTVPVARRLRPGAHRRAWTAEEEDSLRRMAADGALVGEIATALSRTMEGVRNRANALGLPMRSSIGQGRRRLDR